MCDESNCYKGSFSGKKGQHLQSSTRVDAYAHRAQYCAADGDSGHWLDLLRRLVGLVLSADLAQLSPQVVSSALHTLGGPLVAMLSFMVVVS